MKMYCNMQGIPVNLDPRLLDSEWLDIRQLVTERFDFGQLERRVEKDLGILDKANFAKT